MMFAVEIRNRSAHAKMGLLLLALAAITLAPNTLKAELPQYGPDDHLGVASCASSQCHGNVQALNDSDVSQDEYRIWSRHDRHARAYQTLLKPESQKIASKLGLENAHEASICLDCHADNVETTAQTYRFNIEDGVGCEACHGGSQRWLASHVADDASHASNIAAGLYPTDDFKARSELCLSCHLGTPDKFATHEIMGAGHPRLGFELDTFTIRQPRHFQVDDDYRQRKHAEDAVARWSLGALYTAQQYMELLQSPVFNATAIYPEMALFDCHSCHDNFEPEWQARPATASVGPGTVRLNDSSLLIAVVVLSVVDSESSQQLYDLIELMHGASAKNREAIVDISREISVLLSASENTVAQHRFSSDDIRKARELLLELGTRGEFLDYAGAEQAVMSIDVLSYALSQPPPDIEAELERLYAIVGDDDLYPPLELIEQFRVFRAFVAEQSGE